MPCRSILASMIVLYPEKLRQKGLTEFLNGVLWKYDELIQDACWETHINLLIPKRKLAEQEPKTTVLTPVITHCISSS